MKKKVLLISGAYFLIIAVAFLVDLFCNNSICRIRDDSSMGMFLWIFAPLLPTFLLSLSTYWLREEAFKAWWPFARWWVFLIAGVTYYFSKNPDGSMVRIDLFFIGFMYFILVLVSTWRIVRVYWRKKA